MNNNIFTIQQFLESPLFHTYNPAIQDLLISLIEKLKQKNLDFVIVKRNQPVIVFKIAAMYFDTPSSQCNIVTIRFPGNNKLQIEPYEDNDRTSYPYTSSATLSDDIINRIEAIYRRKLQKFYSK
ncbi:MAG: hypothetical protein BWY74_00662 [Firmicutes bacterium ADurb.Bin419]|nr:MAG: hypothetical protein BWY74_00662 [Firmicutes bacterium ADurb.Bin419]